MPTYESDVKPILEARCIRCHGFPPLQSATAVDRFDVFECQPQADASAPACRGAKDVAPLMIGRLQLGNDVPGHMPPKPAAPLSPYQVDTIVKWASQTPPLER